MASVFAGRVRLDSRRITDRDLFYERMASSAAWDAVTNVYETRRRLELVFDRLLRDVPLEGARLLDAGSGGGHFSQAAAQRGAQVTSLDMGPSLLAQVALRCDSRRCVGSVLALPYRDGSFDVVLSTEVIEHTMDPRGALVELARVVRPGGHLVVTTPGRLWQPVVRAATLLRLRPYNGNENFTWPAVARRVLESSGIRVERCVGFNLVPLFVPAFNGLHRLLDRAGGALAPLYVNLAVTGTKR
jgi:2-polyprenyl-3-methyl-5-hydroxy-6-metoxy-1,4-benzoquinol methylase